MRVIRVIMIIDDDDWYEQGSRWTFQATRMNGALGSFVIKPDQMQIANPLLILMLVPLFESVIYPLLNKCFNFTPLRRIGCGLFLCGLSFVASGVLELQLEVSSLTVHYQFNHFRLKNRNYVFKSTFLTFKNPNFDPFYLQKPKLWQILPLKPKFWPFLHKKP